MIRAGLAALALLLTLTAVADDFNHRNSRDRRRGDYRRGYGDGVDCTRLIHKVRESLCHDYQSAPNADREALYGRVGQQRCVRLINAPTHDLFRQAQRSGSPGTRYILNEAQQCEQRRQGSFDDDVDRESEEWHRQNPDPVNPTRP